MGSASSDTRRSYQGELIQTNTGHFVFFFVVCRSTILSGRRQQISAKETTAVEIKQDDRSSGDEVVTSTTPKQPSRADARGSLVAVATRNRFRDQIVEIERCHGALPRAGAPLLVPRRV